MKGDFSKWQSIEDPNYSGVLQQQGRVLLDEDWNAQTRITNRWQDTAAEDAFGPGVAAVPADNPHAYEVSAVVGAGGGSEDVFVTLAPGRVWADGVLVQLGSDIETEEQTIRATYFETPDEERGEGIRDAVVLEVWREAANAFQLQNELLEPALGGPDTTERIHTAMALRLLRLGPGQACENIRHRLENEYKTTGRLTVSLEPTDTVDGDCPVTEVGGYTGFEHCLYRIELAQVNSGLGPMFKWSQFNGGLVGRGDYHQVGDDTWFTITANDQAIKRSGLTEFYLEVVNDGSDTYGHRRVIYGARVVLDGDQLTVVSDEDVLLSVERPADNVFFRLWNGIENIPATDDYELQDGIHLQFHSDPNEYSNPGDFWTFQVRADLPNEQTLVSNQLPHGVKYHRVPIAELHWTDATHAEIEDCRRVFRPLTKQKVCCSYTVGHEGDFPTIQEAVDKLPWWGGEICLLPGIHFASINMQGKFNIRIKGCDLHTLILPAVTGEPIFNITNSWFIALEHMWLATFGGTAIEMYGGGWNEIGYNNIFAYRHAIHVSPWTTIISDVRRSRNAFHYHLHNNVIRMLDRPGGDVAIHFVAEDGLIERNNIAVIPVGTVPPEAEEREDEGDPAEECVEPGSIEADTDYVQLYLIFIWEQDPSSLVLINPFRALGGIQLGGNSWRVRVIENKIFGGDGNGITLGTGDLVPIIEEPEQPEAPPTEDTVNIAFPIIAGVATLGEAPLEESIVINFSGPRNITVTTGLDGSFGYPDEIPDEYYGEYSVSISSPGYEVERVDPGPVLASCRLIIVVVRKVEVEPEISEPFAFLYDIEISRNNVTQVGLCGIGFPIVPPRTPAPALNRLSSIPTNTYVQMGNPIVGLDIIGNRINNCLKNAAVANATLGRFRGLGGISLGMCEDLTIRENTIEDNGRDHRDPVCGIYATYAALADISDNQIVNNGPLNAGADTNIIPGIRGGIVLRKALSITLAGAIKSIRPQAPPAMQPVNDDVAKAIRVAASMGGFAVRIHDNLVKQPIGHSLHIYALGPVSVANNQLVTDSVEPRQRPALAGSVFITNYGQPHYVRRFTSVQPLPSGSVIFSNNRVRLSVANCWTSQTILSADDIAYVGNHSDVMEEIRPILFNVLLGALTIRASENRIQENIGWLAFAYLWLDVVGLPIDHIDSDVSGEPKVSLFSYSVFMNNTTNNQGNHCLLAVNVARDPIFSDNQALVVPAARCIDYQTLLNQYSRVLLPGFLRLVGGST